MTMAYFGRRWDAPVFDDMQAVETPVGQTCLNCTEPVEHDDSGVVMPHMDARGNVYPSPVHLECHLRSVLGSVAHLEGRCSCATGRRADDRTAQSYRDQARATLAWLQEHRRGGFA